MNKNDVVKLDESIVRILDTKDDKYLVIDSGILISEEGRVGGKKMKIDKLVK